MIMEIGIITAIAALLLIATSKLMSAQNTEVVLPDNAIYLGGGDPGIIMLTASEAITAGDNVVSSANGKTIAKCAAGGTTYTGTADLNQNAALDNNVPASHDFANGEIVPVITGNCIVRKVADTAGVKRGQVCKIGAADGAECGDLGSAATKYMIGRARTTAASTVAFPMRQY